MSYNIYKMNIFFIHQYYDLQGFNLSKLFEWFKSYIFILFFIVRNFTDKLLFIN